VAMKSRKGWQKRMTVPKYLATVNYIVENSVTPQ